MSLRPVANEDIDIVRRAQVLCAVAEPHPGEVPCRQHLAEARRALRGA